MALRHHWSETQIREALAPVESVGEARILFNNMSDAERFRYACYNLRRRRNIGRDYSFILDASGGEGVEVLVTRTPIFKLERVR